MGGLVLFDFKAAFPSMSHDYMMAVLDHIGVPRHSLNFIKALYDDNRCVLSCKGRLFDGFAVSSGIRQGCPLSPLLFVATIDFLLRELATRFPTS